MNGKKKTFLRAAIMVGLMFAVLPMATSSVQASPGIVVLLNDTVENVTWSNEYWTSTGLWHIETTSPCSCTDNNTWYYGQNKGDGVCNYDTGATNSGTLTSQAIDLTDAVAATLTFWTHWVDEPGYPTYDIRKVEINSSGVWETLMDSSTPGDPLYGDTGTGEITKDISNYTGGTVQIRFSFDTRDEWYNNYYGWCIDDIKVEKEVECVPGIEVEKTVWNETTGAWVDEITANISDTVRFNCTIHNNGTCCNLTNITVMDTMSDSLEYVGVDDSPPPNEVINNSDGTTTLKWFLPGPLAPCESMTFLIYANVTKCGEDWNKQNATAEACNGEIVYDEDYAYVNVPPKPAIEVNKTVKDPETGEWVDKITANISDIVRFNCTIHNNGTCCNLTNINVTDTLPESLAYAGNATVNGEPQEPNWTADNQFGWNFTGPLAPCETIAIEFDAHVIGNDTNCNVQNATAYCEKANKWVSDEDTACIYVPPGEPDLKITNKLETWLNLTHYNITYTVKNIGGANATNVSRINITRDGSVETDTVPALNASESHTATFGPYAISGDNDTIRICADIDNNVSESNEDNNCLQNILHKSTTIEVNTTGWWVKPVEGDSAEGEFHSSPNTPIQDAIDNATAGCTIIVHDGTYNEQLTINKSLTLMAGSSPVLDFSGCSEYGINITADNVTIDGFEIIGIPITGLDDYSSSVNPTILVEANYTTVQNCVFNNASGAPAKEAMLTVNGTHNNSFLNNVVNNYIYGVTARCPSEAYGGGAGPGYGATNLTVSGNTFNVAYIDDGTNKITGEAVQIHYGDNIVVTDNIINGPGKFVDKADTYTYLNSIGIADFMSGFGAAGTITYSNNTVTNCYVGIATFAGNGIISDNLIDDNYIGIQVGQNDEVLISTPAQGVQILNNNITHNYRGIWAQNFVLDGLAAHFNNIIGNTEYGVINEDQNEDQENDVFDATNNWWGDPCGPGPVGPGRGDNVSDNVTYTPWLDAPYPGGEAVESCARVYFKPENSSALYCNTTEVEIWVNATGDFQSGQINLTYNQTCANVTSWVLNTTNFGFGGWTHKNGGERISFARDNSQAGKYMLGTLTIHCVNSSEKGCNTSLKFDNGSELFDDYGKTLPVEWTNGTFNCTGLSCGDANCDGDVDVGDATLTLNHWTSAGKYPLCSEWAGDVNCDGDVNVGDATLILNHWLSGYSLNCCSV